MTMGQTETLNLDKPILSTLLGADLRVQCRLEHLNQFVSKEGENSRK